MSRFTAFTRTDFGFAVTLDPRQLDTMREELRGVAGAFERASVAAVSRTVERARTRIRQRMRRESGLPAKAINERVRMKRPRFVKGAEVVTEGRVRILGRKIPLNLFQARQGKRVGVTYRDALKGGRVKLPAAAILQTKHGPSVLQRQHKGRGFVGRYPWLIRYGPGLSEIFDNAPGIVGEELSALQGEMEKNVMSQIDRFLNRRKADRPR